MRGHHPRTQHATTEQHTYYSGFSLVELSIVLVILGLLVGGILGGQSLIRAAEMRAVITEIEQWQTAVNVFKGRYHQLPGDTNLADRLWPDASANGDANGRVADTDHTARESFLFWQHLALAGLIPGQYTGQEGGGGIWHHIPGENSPRSRVTGGSWTGWHYDNRTTSTNAFYFDYGNMFIFGAVMPGSSTRGPLLSPEEAWSVDAKFDDGEPAQGKVHGLSPNNDCTTAVNHEDFEAKYNLGVSGQQCALAFAHAM